MNIKLLQEKLQIPTTGEFDEFTEAAVRNFQIKNNIPVTGVVDNPTKELLGDDKEGFVDTDRTSRNRIRNYPLSKDEYIVGTEKKEYIFLHHTAGWNDPYKVIKDWETDERKNIGVSYVIGGIHPTTLDPRFNGEIVKALPEKDYGWHLGIGNVPMHRNSIGIELCNFGYLFKRNNDYFTYTNTRVNPNEIIDLKREYRGHQYYHRYTEKQIESLKWLILDIANRWGIDVTQGLQKKLKSAKDPWTAFDYDPQTKDIKGLHCHTNVSPKNRYGRYEKWDLFPQPEIIEMLLSL